MQNVAILITGGTIDKVHDMLGETIGFAPDGASHLPQILAQGRCDFPRLQQVLCKDSLDFTDADRDAIVAAIAAAPETAIVITHGTGTMGQSARWIMARISGKTIVLTGAMRPFSFGVSDGPFNIGGAIIAAQVLPAGVYGVMNGRVFAADALDKNTASGRFDQ